MRNGLDRDTVEALLEKASEHLKAMREGEGWTSKRFDFSETDCDDNREAGGWNYGLPRPHSLRLTDPPSSLACSAQSQRCAGRI